MQPHVDSHPSKLSMVTKSTLYHVYSANLYSMVDQGYPFTMNHTLPYVVCQPWLMHPSVVCKPWLIRTLPPHVNILPPNNHLLELVIHLVMTPRRTCVHTRSSLRIGVKIQGTGVYLWIEVSCMDYTSTPAMTIKRCTESKVKKG